MYEKRILMQAERTVYYSYSYSYRADRHDSSICENISSMIRFVYLLVSPQLLVNENTKSGNIGLSSLSDKDVIPNL